MDKIHHLYIIRVGDPTRSLIVKIGDDTAPSYRSALQAALNYAVRRGCAPKIMDAQLVTKQTTFSKEGYDAAMKSPMVDLDKAMEGVDDRDNWQKYAW